MLIYPKFLIRAQCETPLYRLRLRHFTAFSTGLAAEPVPGLPREDGVLSELCIGN
jgi:hypothetical protein